MKIAILTGGTSGERSVSIASANNLQNLFGPEQSQTFILPEAWEEYVKSYKNFDVAIPMIHGKGGEDGSIQKELEILKVPYLFSGIEAHEIGIDKKRSKLVAQKLGYLVPKEIQSTIFPFFAKPRFGGSSVASALCTSETEYKKLLKLSQEEFILEEPIKGREFTVGVVEIDNLTKTLPVIEIVTSPNSFFDFDHKYNPDNLAQEICPAEISDLLSEQLKSTALAIHEDLGVKHISRSDFIVTAGGDIYFLEINTIPGMTDTSLIPKMLNVARIDLKNLIEQWSKAVKSI